MRLISLSANKPSFKTVLFNKSGLTLVVGRHRATAKTDLKKTYNGVGKSLIVALVNYCLGSNKNQAFDTHLQGWAFTLKFEHASQIHSVTRAPGEAKLVVDGGDISFTSYKKFLDGLGIFRLPSRGVHFLTTRSLLSFFLRPKNSSYVRYDRPREEWTEYQSVLCQSFLLGLDYELAVKKHERKKRLDELVNLSDRYKKDRELRAFYLHEKNAEVELLELGAEISRYESDLSSFRVAESYADRQARADHLHQEIDNLSNELVIRENLLEDVRLALRVTPDVAPNRVIEAYEEAAVSLPSLVVKRLDDVQAFHRRLQDNRNRRLMGEMKDAQSAIASISARSRDLQKQLDAELQFLNAHRALDEYAANSAHLSSLRAREARVRDYLRLLSQYTEEGQKERAAMARETVEATQLVHESKPHLDLLMQMFREYSRELYGPVTAGLTVKNDDGENQCRYAIDAHIQNDAADGINQGKIFCYDFLLLTLRCRHSCDFLFHDNRLFADMDKHQRLSLFKLADRVAKDMNLQYIATINEDVVDSVRDIAGSDFDRLFVSPVVLELTDAPNGAGKLLGVQVDIDYDQ